MGRLFRRGSDALCPVAVQVHQELLVRSHSAVGGGRRLPPICLAKRPIAVVDMAESIFDFVITPHARSAMRRRSVAEEVVREVLQAPEQRQTLRPGRDVVQSRIDFGARRYLVRVFVDVSRDPPEVVTVYRTSKVGKYWSW